MKQLLSFLLLIVVSTDSVGANDDEILDTLRHKVTEAYLEQPPSILNVSLRDRGLPESDIERIIRRFAEAGGQCFVNAVVSYSKAYEIPLSQFVSEGVVTPSAENEDAFARLLEPCLLEALQDAGAGTK